MAKSTQAPTIIKRDPVHGDTETHPAYGQITVHRVSGGGTYLYGSDFQHQYYVQVAIHESTLNRNLSNDWPHATKHIIEVAMSEAQWATFVSSFNMGGGVQCTIQEREGVGVIPELPPPNKTDLFKTEANERLQTMDRELTKLRHKIEETTVGLSKVKQRELLDILFQAHRQVNDGIPWVAQQLEEHMEDVVEAAKSEVHGYIQNQINRAGLHALGGTSPDLLALPDAEKDQ